MPRQNRRRGDEPRARSAPTSERTEDFRGKAYVVRSVSGRGAPKPYRCPGCDQLVAAGGPHLVVWPAHDVDADERRHWHSTCWQARGRRAPVIQRSRNAPRY